MIFALASTEIAGYKYSELGIGYCRDYVYLPEGGYPDRFNAGEDLYDPSPIQECLNRCMDAYGQDGASSGKIGNQAFYLYANSKCACATGDCNARSSSGSYKSYEIIPGNR